MDALIEESDTLLRLHLKSSGVRTSTSWSLAKSPIGGRGIFATEDIFPGDIVFIDPPLVIGPRSGQASQPICVGCHRSGVDVFACSRGCGLPVCDKRCEIQQQHAEECDRLRGWRQEKKDDNTWSPELLRALTPVRCLSLNNEQRRLVRCLEAHTGPLHEHELKLLKKNLDIPPDSDDDDFMRFCCCAFDANAFEVSAQIPASIPDNTLMIASTTPVVPSPVTHTSMRGLYPLAAMMNHACTPNTRHGYDKNMCMVVQASVPIPRGGEITTSYFALLWGTTARRQHLSKTKHFLCMCERCRDPRESGTFLCALKCAMPSCPGSLLSEDPVKIGTKWICDVCGVRLQEKQTRMIQSGLGTMLRAINCDNPVQVEAFLRGHNTLFATTNQVIVELKSCLVWIYGHFPGYHWPDLSDSALETKLKLCRELLKLLVMLNAGECRLRGLFLYELHCTLVEIRRRRGGDITKEERCELSQAIQEAASMFQQDVTAPPDLWVRHCADQNSHMDADIIIQI